MSSRDIVNLEARQITAMFEQFKDMVEKGMIKEEHAISLVCNLEGSNAIDGLIDDFIFDLKTIRDRKENRSTYNSKAIIICPSTLLNEC